MLINLISALEGWTTVFFTQKAAWNFVKYWMEPSIYQFGPNSLKFLECFAKIVCKYVTQHIKRDQLSHKIKIDFLLFPKWLFFQLNFGAKICVKLDIAFWRYGSFIEDVVTD